MSLIRSGFNRGGVVSSATAETRFGLDEYVQLLNEFQYSGLTYSSLGDAVQQTLAGQVAESVGSDFVGLARQAYSSNGVVFSCMLSRQLVFSGIKFRWQRLLSGRPSLMFGSPDLRLLESPWPGGTTQDLLSRIIQDADLAGNSYWVNVEGELVRLRPDWVDIALVPRRGAGGQQVGWKKIAYGYTEGGSGSGNSPAVFDAKDVAHFAPLPDPLASYRGMSWLTPVVREIQGDQLMNTHKRKYFENGASPNMIVRHAENADMEKAQRFKEMMNEKHAGIDNAYRTLHLYPGADVTVVGNDLRQIDFKSVQGHGETRIAAAAGVPPVIAGLSEGIAAATYSNYGQARRRFADGTIHPLWMNVAGSLAPLLKSQPNGVRLWYDTHDVPFLREDEKDAAVIAETQARTIRSLVDGGYTPESVIVAVESKDWGLLKHSGFLSVQLQKPGESPSDAASSSDDSAESDDDVVVNDSK